MSKETVIFLDVDGVLGNAHTKGLRIGFAWLDDENITPPATGRQGPPRNILVAKCAEPEYYGIC